MGSAVAVRLRGSIPSWKSIWTCWAMFLKSIVANSVSDLQCTTKLGTFQANITEIRKYKSPAFNTFLFNYSQRPINLRHNYLTYWIRKGPYLRTHNDKSWYAPNQWHSIIFLFHTFFSLPLFLMSHLYLLGRDNVALAQTCGETFCCSSQINLFCCFLLGVGGRVCRFPPLPL